MAGGSFLARPLPTSLSYLDGSLLLCLDEELALTTLPSQAQLTPIVTGSQARFPKGKGRARLPRLLWEAQLLGRTEKTDPGPFGVGQRLLLWQQASLSLQGTPFRSGC